MYKLLIADDESLEREALHYFVQQSSLEIDTIIECTNGSETVNKVILEKPDIILIDINMPGLTGLEAMERVKGLNQQCKVIFSTAFDYFEYALKALQLGAMDFIVKPVKKELLISVLNKAIDQLDEEHEKAYRSSRIKEMMEMAGDRIVGELVTGNFTEEVFYHLELMDINSNCNGNCFCFKIKSSYEKEQKKKLIKLIKEELALIGFSVLINWKNDIITLIVFNCQGIEREKVNAVMKGLLFGILEREDFSYVPGVGIMFDDINQIEHSYLYARGIDGDIKVDIAKEDSEIEDVPLNIKKTCDFIEKNYDIKISLDDIAQSLGYSKYHICRLFKQHMGITLNDYLVQLRIKKAKELLKEETYSIKQISYMVGYSDPNYFTFSFKKIEGISPVKYRYSGKETN